MDRTQAILDELRIRTRWQTPIYNRTQKDIDNHNPIAYLNVSDMNRIEGNIGYIAELMGIDIVIKEWKDKDLPTTADFKRIGENIKTLETQIAFTHYEDYPISPINTFQKLNTIEAIIAAIRGDYELIMASSFYCGEDSYAGSELI